MNFLDVEEIRNGAFYIAFLKNQDVILPNSDLLIYEGDLQ